MLPNIEAKDRLFPDAKRTVLVWCLDDGKLSFVHNKPCPPRSKNTCCRLRECFLEPINAPKALDYGALHLTFWTICVLLEKLPEETVVCMAPAMVSNSSPYCLRDFREISDELFNAEFLEICLSLKDRK